MHSVWPVHNQLPARAHLFVVTDVRPPPSLRIHHASPSSDGNRIGRAGRRPFGRGEERRLEYHRTTLGGPAVHCLRWNRYHETGPRLPRPVRPPGHDAGVGAVRDADRLRTPRPRSAGTAPLSAQPVQPRLRPHRRRCRSAPDPLLRLQPCFLDVPTRVHDTATGRSTPQTVLQRLRSAWGTCRGGGPRSYG